MSIHSVQQLVQVSLSRGQKCELRILGTVQPISTEHDGFAA